MDRHYLSYLEHIIRNHGMMDLNFKVIQDVIYFPLVRVIECFKLLEKNKTMPI